MKEFKKRKLLDLVLPFRDEPETIVITGFRRVGKTFILQHLYDTTASSNKLFLDMENPLNQRVFETDNYDLIPQALSQKGLDISQKSYIFLDEIQQLTHLPSVVKYLGDHNPFKFYLTGSSSFYLQNRFTESLAGRKILFELYPLDFEEFLRFKQSNLTTSSDPSVLDGLYEEFLQYGGFPSVVLTDSPVKKGIELDNILGSYFQLDVQSLSGFRDNRNLRSLMVLLAQRVGGKSDISKLADNLGVARGTVYNYLEFLTQTYLIHQLPAYSNSPDISIRRIPKVYFCDTGLLNRVSQISQGALFENKVFNQLHTRLSYSRPGRLLEPIHYFQKRDGKEIDFIVEGKIAYETKISTSTFDLSRLEKIATALKLADYFLVSLEPPRQENSRIRRPFEL